MPRKSAGLLLFRTGQVGLEVLLVHPGGPFWQRKDDGVWTIPKGEWDDPEDGLEAAKREFSEETGGTAQGEFIPLRPVRQRGGKVVHAWAVRSDFDTTTLTSNTFSMEWPPRSGREQRFPEVDQAAWFSLPEARSKILPGQRPLLDELETVAIRSPSP